MNEAAEEAKDEFQKQQNIDESKSIGSLSTAGTGTEGQHKKIKFGGFKLNVEQANKAKLDIAPKMSMAINLQSNLDKDKKLGAILNLAPGLKKLHLGKEQKNPSFQSEQSKTSSVNSEKFGK